VPQDWATIERALYGSRQGRFRDWSPQTLVALVAGRPPSFPPGTAWSYSNTGYILLGLVVETLHGADFTRALQQVLPAFGALLSLGGMHFAIS
jgi:CubicO group peptidase (beta-lactamase class C family)